MDEGQQGRDWTDAQNDLIVEDYFTMLAIELAGASYVKSHHNSALQLLTGRNRGSIERKHMNISAVMMHLGLPRIKGYAPNANYQAGLLGAVERYLIRQGLPTHPSATKLTSGVSEARELWIGPPPSLRPETTKTTPELERLVRKFDPAARDAHNRSLGKEGELLVFEHEVRRLTFSRRLDLAKKVEWTSQERGDGAGYDIASFEIDGQPRLIEVKTTNGTAITPFYLSENELSFSEERPDAFTLLRLYNFAEQPSAFELRPPLSALLSLMPTSYRATLL
jgi:Domain of unknown function (DUF3883)